ncbi:acyl-CoA thioesterase [Comamonadaceae bacterium OTU4NAUVB1]|jgi:acyl-CoA thioester hydrolase|nr:acyl-CoA thioesterase [Comamonadaceae bacterium OTU4NAUVB1]HSU22800.1 thioesterase family protein [Variovorax sp.]
MSTSRIPASQRHEFRAFRRIPTRWADNDLYGHVNNVVYYTWFDTAINSMLIEEGVLDLHGGSIAGFVVETHCNYLSPISYPQEVDIGIRVGRIGTSSVRYELAVFPKDEEHACAQGHFVHVYVDRATQRPVPISGGLAQLLQRLVWP